MRRAKKKPPQTGGFFIGPIRLGLKLTDPVFDASTLTPEPAPALQRYVGGSGHLRRDRPAGDRQRPGRRHGALHRLDAPEGQRQQEPAMISAVVAKSRADYWEATRSRRSKTDRAAHGQKPLKDKPRENRFRRRPRSLAPIPRAATWCATASRRASSISITAPWMAGSASSPTPMRRQPMCMTRIVYLGRLDRQRAALRLRCRCRRAGCRLCHARHRQGPRGSPHSRRHRLSQADPAEARHDARARRSSTKRDSTAIAARRASCSAYATTDRTGYRHYKSDPSICRDLPAAGLLHVQGRTATRLITRHVWADARERTDAHRLTPWGKAHLQTPQGDGRALLCRRQAASRPPLCTLPRARSRVACQCSSGVFGCGDRI